jgi:ribonucleoside-diphosphate reductase alpha chain
MNAVNFKRWKDTGSVFIAIIFLDSLCNEFLEKAKDVKGLEKVVRYTKKAKSLGLGLLGLASYLQDNMLPFTSISARIARMELFKHLHDESILASQYVYQCGGGAEMMVQYAKNHPEWIPQAHSHLRACAPNVSSAVLAGQVSQGIECYLANIFMQPTSAGELRRINPTLLALMKERNMYKPSVIKRIIDHKGSVQQENWLTDKEKAVLLTGFEINQLELVECCAEIQQWVDQGISLNLFFDSDTDPDYIKATHLMVLFDERLNGCYYCRSESGVMAAKNTESCVDCES